MVSVAAGLARQGLRPWVYSIAPFVYARPFEQIRNDVCLHRLPVVLVGNGGGYGYGVMGSTHHALEDYGVLLTLSGLQAFIPAFDSDLATLIPSLCESQQPSYLRLGLGEQPRTWTAPPFGPWTSGRITLGTVFRTSRIAATEFVVSESASAAGTARRTQKGPGSVVTPDNR